MNAEQTNASLNLYTRVFVALLILTAVTVGVSLLHLPRYAAVALAIVVATLKGSLIAWYFMNLKTERALVWVSMLVGITAVIILVIGVLPDLAWKLR